jgi:transcriptional regulator with XRE-family HTH domain
MDRNQFLVSLGARLRSVRKQKRITQQQLAVLCNIEKANLSRIESGITNPTILTLFKMSKALDTTLPDIFTGH